MSVETINRLAILLTIAIYGVVFSSHSDAVSQAMGGAALSGELVLADTASVEEP
ncbi:MAG: hypothetical protein ACI8RZ_001040 [Myxococcota bacterium]|jgi:hypothetical protein